VGLGRGDGILISAETATASDGIGAGVPSGVACGGATAGASEGVDAAVASGVDVDEVTGPRCVSSQLERAT